jgi:hypothetical protein
MLSVCAYYLIILFDILQGKLSSSVMQPSGAHLHSAVEDKQTCSSETVIQNENTPSFPATTKSASDRHNTNRALTLTQSVTCSLPLKPYDSSLYAATAARNKDSDLKYSEDENSGGCKHRNSGTFSKAVQVKSHEVPNYRLKSDKKPHDKETEVLGVMGLTPNANVLQSGSSANAENRVRRVENIRLELVSWRQKQNNAHTIRYSESVHIANKRKGRTGSKKWNENTAASETLTYLSSKHCDSHPMQQEMRDSSTGSHRKYPPFPPRM